MESKKHLSRRDFLKLAAVASTGAAVAACAPSAPAPAPAAPAKQEAAPTAAPAAKQPITVRLWVAWGNMNKLFQDEVWYKMPEYETVVGSNIKIEYKGNTGDQQVQTAIAAGDPPEAASNISYAQLAIKDVFLDTQPLVDTSKYIKKDDY
ncbi:MAG: twin-arginine translocation signal domain-containing protein, partial [Anaerolineae bacterium]|nr:twin-arginine translocation signal domain-containing protein [Anaerolineae bacterium]